MIKRISNTAAAHLWAMGYRPARSTVVEAALLELGVTVAQAPLTRVLLVPAWINALWDTMIGPDGGQTALLLRCVLRHMIARPEVVERWRALVALDVSSNGAHAFVEAVLCDPAPAAVPAAEDWIGDV